MAETIEAHVKGLDEMECSKPVDHALGDSATTGGVVGDGARPLGPDDVTMAPFHHEERLAHHPGV